jgi:hypothetical protein
VTGVVVEVEFDDEPEAALEAADVAPELECFFTPADAACALTFVALTSATALALVDEPIGPATATVAQTAMNSAIVSATARRRRTLWRRARRRRRWRISGEGAACMQAVSGRDPVAACGEAERRLSR